MWLHCKKIVMMLSPVAQNGTEQPKGFDFHKSLWRMAQVISIVCHSIQLHIINDNKMSLFTDRFMRETDDDIFLLLTQVFHILQQDSILSLSLSLSHFS